MNLKVSWQKSMQVVFTAVQSGRFWTMKKKKVRTVPFCYKKTNHFIQPRRGALNNGIAAFFSGEHVYR